MTSRSASSIRRETGYRERHRRSFGDDAPIGLRHESIELPELVTDEKRYEDDEAAYITGQMKELLTQYGDIDVLWYDGSAGAIRNDRCANCSRG